MYYFDIKGRDSREKVILYKKTDSGEVVIVAEADNNSMISPACWKLVIKTRNEVLDMVLQHEIAALWSAHNALKVSWAILTDSKILEVDDNRA